MTTETDAEFVERLASDHNGPIYEAEMARLFALARRGAAMQWRPIETAPKEKGKYLLVVNKAQAANIVFLDNEVDQLQFRLRAMVKRYDIDHPLRTGDVHDPDCGCMRCERDRAATLLAKGGRL